MNKIRLQMLKAKLYLLKQQEQEEKLSGIRGEVTDIAWGNQIRSYVMSGALWSRIIGRMQSVDRWTP